MPPHSFSKQRDIVIATMTLHNYIRRHPSRSDIHFRACDVDEHFIYPTGLQNRTGQNMLAQVETMLDGFRYE
ncbi:hypothetical protein KSP40_PGU016115 [Platanthera guangdongensis]|uniref:Uncharacterized protein n=1 Tax=Platanthera guangdongensis TaxID=2320717 RepID=A0ABR2M4N0_9ASPA